MIGTESAQARAVSTATMNGRGRPVRAMKHPERWEEMRVASEALWPGVGSWAYDVWADHNDRYFDNALEPAAIVWGLTPHGHALGSCSHSQPTRITMHTSLLQPSGDAWKIGHKLGRAFASDVLLHEMIHQVIHERGDGRAWSGDKSSHNNEFWVAEVNRIAPKLGLPANAGVCKQRRTESGRRVVPPDGCMSRAALSSWPHSARPEGHYERLRALELEGAE